jgi:transaldolase
MQLPWRQSRRSPTYIDDEPEFRWAPDQMAFDKLHEGIKEFALDGQILQHI